MAICNCTDRCKCSGRKCLQFIIAGVLAVLMIGALVFNKVSLVWLLGGTIINSVRLETWYAAIGLVLIVPEAVALLKVFWNTSFIKRTGTHRWPSGVALVVGFLVSFAEVTSFLVFTLEVAPRLPVQVLLPILSAVFSVSLCHELWENVKFRKDKEQEPEVQFDGNFTLHQRQEHDDNNDGATCWTISRWKRVMKTILGFSGVWASCAISGIVVIITPLPWFQALCLPACLCLLSLCWHPKVQVYIVRSHDGTFNGRWKATCLYTVFKIVILMVGLSIVMVIRLREHGVLDKNFFFKLWDGLYACRHKEIFYPLIIHFCSSFAGHVIAYVSATLCFPSIGITLPAIIATPASVGTVMFLCSPTFHWLDEVMCFTQGTGIWCACLLGAIIWFAPLVLKGPRLTRSSRIFLKPYDELFIQPTWNSIFMDQHMILNYKHDGFAKPDPSLFDEGKALSRIFICTTMYREADFEMGRLLRSIRKVSESKRLKNTYLEAHIFLDNGTSNMHLTDFASQLVSLLESKMGVTAKDASAYMTPYGVQLHWTLPNGGMPFFIHLKDSNKVKPKKRWSQVMYMSYVLNFRVLRDQSKEKLLPVRTRATTLVDDAMLVGYASDKEWKKNTAQVNDDHKQQPSPSPSANTNGANTPFFIRENRKHLARMFNTDPEGKNMVTTKLPITNLIETYRSDTTLPTTASSSDQGIGNSDGLSISSFSTKNEDVESSEADPSRQNSIKDHRNDEGWQDYEGDVSSNNENSLTSLKARRARDLLREGRDNSGRPGNMQNQTPDRPPRPKRHHSTIHPPRHRQMNHHKPRKELKTSSSRAQLLADIDVGLDSPPDTENHGARPLGKDNPGFEAEQDGTHPPESLKVSLAIADSQIFTISRKTVPSKKSTHKKRIPLDDHTYILATDADMDFDDNSVLDLLSLCNHDRRLGGVCGRTHPIGQKSGPLVWYQKFEYAKDFWMIKSAQNVIGSVMCCPGCFSLYRAAAVRDVMANYAGPTDQPFDVFVKDTGEDRWMCTLMMLHGWKLEYNAFCDNTTYCPDTFAEFMKQRRRWVLSDMANMLLVFKNILKLAQKNDSFSIAYILYMVQMFTIVLLSPASTVVILAGGLDIVYGLPFEIIGSLLGVMIIAYALVCIIGSFKAQTRVTFILMIIMGLAMLLVVIGGSVYVIHDILSNFNDGTLTFQEYYLILLLIAALVFASLIHPKETWIMAHGLSYLVGFPAMQILLPIYAICNIVDTSWGTRDQNKSKSPPVSCFSKHRKHYHKSLSKKSQLPEEKPAEVPVEVEGEKPVECTTNKFTSMADGHSQHVEEHHFWTRMCHIALGRDVNRGLEGTKLASGLRTLRNICLLSMLVLNALWLILLSVLYFNAELNLARLNVYGLIAGAVYGLVLFIQVLGMAVHRVQAIFTRLGRSLFGRETPIWIYNRKSKR